MTKRASLAVLLLVMVGGAAVFWSWPELDSEPDQTDPGESHPPSLAGASSDSRDGGSGAKELSAGEGSAERPASQERRFWTAERAARSRSPFYRVVAGQGDSTGDWKGTAVTLVGPQGRRPIEVEVGGRAVSMFGSPLDVTVLLDKSPIASFVSQGSGRQSGILDLVVAPPRRLRITAIDTERNPLPFLALAALRKDPPVPRGYIVKETSSTDPEGLAEFFMCAGEYVISCDGVREQGVSLVSDSDITMVFEFVSVLHGTLDRPDGIYYRVQVRDDYVPHTVLATTGVIGDDWSATIARPPGSSVVVALQKSVDKGHTFTTVDEMRVVTGRAGPLAFTP